ncbi:hypothetical protein QJQ45_009041 [Haematococcus lacustris]|nr:hypothetical protein QJQ45_009041 [Haematococcus lacustris]
MWCPQLHQATPGDFGKWVDRDCNAALNMQRAGESKWRPLELCRWPHRAWLPAKGREYPALGFKKRRDRAPKALAQRPVAQLMAGSVVEAVLDNLVSPSCLHPPQSTLLSSLEKCIPTLAMGVKAELATVDKANTVTESLARVNFHPECEAAINEQINIEYAISYVYHSLYAYFDRDNVGLPGFAKYFKAASDEEREHAELLMQYQNKRGGRVKLGGIMTPEMEFAHHDKGEALYAMELALAMEKLNFQKLRELHDVADKHGDASFADFVEGQLLADQVESVKKAAEQVSQLRRVGQGLGVYLYDKELGA